MYYYFRRTIDRKFTIIDEITREYRRFNTRGTQLTVRLLPPDEIDPVSHFIASVSSLCDYALQNCDESDMVGISIRNEVNMRVKLLELALDVKISSRQT